MILGNDGAMGLAQATDVDSTYIPVSVATLIPEKTIGTSLYLRRQSDDVMQLYCSPDIPIEHSNLADLLVRGHSTVFIRASEHVHYQQYLRDNMDGILDDESLPAEERFGCLNGVIRDVLAGSFRGGKMDETVDTCRDLADKTVDFVLRDDVLQTDLLGVMNHDYHTFTHSANVSYYCVMLAGSLKLADQATLKEIACGALLSRRR